jgi:DNA repair photolyase
MKQFKGKAIYQPEGAAAEYAKYACNFYIGCSNDCTYCFNKRWKWGNTPKLKACFKDETHALEVFEKELKANLPELQKHGLFFSFTTDPFLKETRDLSVVAIALCVACKIPVKVLTKRADFFELNDFGVYLQGINIGIKCGNDIAFGFTLTGHDELEPGASTNAERIAAMQQLHDAGFKVWASIEPVIDFESSYEMIYNTIEFCDLYKIGLKSRTKYDREDTADFISLLLNFTENKYYFKDSLLKAAGIDRSELPSNCATRDYNMFN